MTVFNKIDCYTRRFQLAWSQSDSVTTVTFNNEDIDFYFLFKDLLSKTTDIGDTSTFSFDDENKIIKQINLRQSETAENAALIALRIKKFFEDLSKDWQPTHSPYAQELKTRYSRPRDHVFTKSEAAKEISLLRLFIKIAFPTYSNNYLNGKVIVEGEGNTLFLIGKASHIQALLVHFTPNKPLPYNEEDEKAYYKEELERAEKIKFINFEYHSWIRICQLRANL